MIDREKSTEHKESNSANGIPDESWMNIFTFLGKEERQIASVSKNCKKLVHTNRIRSHSKWWNRVKKLSNDDIGFNITKLVTRTQSGEVLRLVLDGLVMHSVGNQSFTDWLTTSLILVKISENTNAPTDVLARLLKVGNDENDGLMDSLATKSLKLTIAGHRNTSGDTLDIVLKKSDEILKLVIAKHINTLSKTLGKLGKLKKVILRHLVCNHPNVSDNVRRNILLDKDNWFLKEGKIEIVMAIETLLSSVLD
jgi:hypothetical protein